MIRVGHRSRWVWAALAVLTLVFLIPVRDGTVTVLGDAAPAVRAALPEGLTPRQPSDVILLRRSESLRHLPEVQRLCRGRCDAGVTTLYEILPGGGRKFLIFDLSTFEGVDAIDRGDPLPAAVTACVTDAVVREAATLFRATPPPCIPSSRFRVVLPYGL